MASKNSIIDTKYTNSEHTKVRKFGSKDKYKV